MLVKQSVHELDALGVFTFFHEAFGLSLEAQVDFGRARHGGWVDGTGHFLFARGFFRGSATIWGSFAKG
jgi:hypothetical protein